MQNVKLTLLCRPEHSEGSHIGILRDSPQDDAAMLILTVILIFEL